MLVFRLFIIYTMIGLFFLPLIFQPFLKLSKFFSENVLLNALILKLFLKYLNYIILSFCQYLF